ncbi:MAG: pitrilysin family protein [Desulfobacterales bacterium]
MERGIHKTVLHNGVILLTQEVPHARSVSMGVWVNAGARDETLEQSGLSHFIEHMIFKGTRKRDAFQIAKEFDAIGGQTNAFTSMELTCYHAKVMDTHLSTMVDILSDIFLNSVFSPEEVDKERPVILQEIGMVEDNPEEWVHTLLLKSFWGDHPLGRSILGTRDNIIRFDADTIKNFLTQFYQPDRIVISAAGNFEHKNFENLIRSSFESVKAESTISRRFPPCTKPSVTVSQRDLEQVHICLATSGITTTDPRRYAFSLLNTILGGNMSSRLFQEIRERRGLAYSVYSFASSHTDTGMLGIYAGVSPEKADEVIELLVDQIKKLEYSRIEESELSDAKQYTKGNILLSSENMDNLMVRIAQNEISFGHEIPIRAVLDEIEKVTIEDIMELNHALLKEKCLAISVLGPVSELKSDISLN